MARVTDTRQRVRELAGQLASQGIEPTPSLIRSFLGKGSPNTVVDELRRWKDEQPPAVPSFAAPGAQPPAAQIGSPMPIEKAALQELAGALAQATQLLATQAEVFVRIGSLERLLEHSLHEQQELRSQLSAALTHFTSSQEAYATQLAQMESRYDAVQKYMLKSIEDAREEGRVWKERAKNAQADLSTWRGVTERKVATLTAENSTLKEQLAAATGAHR